MKKRILAMFAALVMGVSVLSGCNSNSETSGADNSGNNANDEIVQMISELTSEITELRNMFTLAAGDLIGDFVTLSDKEADELNKIFEIHEMNLLADPPSGTKVKTRDWSKYTTDHAKDNLNDAEAELYDRLYDTCEMYINEPTHATPSNDKSCYYISSQVDFYDLGLTVEEARNVEAWFRANNPQFYFIKNSFRNDGKRIYIVIYDFVMNSSDQAALTNEMFDKLDSWIAECGNEVTIWDKITSANKKICENIVYSPNVKAKVPGAAGGKNQSMYSVLMSDDTVCTGYAYTFTAMANAMGIDTYTVGSDNHAWNAARFNDGNYYYVDVCWNDPDNDKVFKEDWIGVGTDYAENYDAHELTESSQTYGPDIQTGDYNGEDKTGAFEAPSLRIGGSGGHFVKIEWDAVPGAEKYAYQVTSGVSSYADTSTKDNYIIAVIPEGVSSVNVKVRAVGTKDGKNAYSKWSEITASLGSSTGSADKPVDVNVARRDDGGIRLSWKTSKNVDGWLIVNHGSDNTFTSVSSKSINAQNIIAIIWPKWEPESDAHFSVMSIKRSGNTEIYSEPVQVKYNIKDGMRLADNTASGGSVSSSGTSVKATLEFSTGTYEGDVVNGVMHGKGTFTFTNGNIYEGDFADGQQTGQGKLTYANGKIVYEGEFKNGTLFSGKITKIQDNGTAVYESDNFIDGKMNGKGTYTFKFNGGDVRIYSGIFKDNKLNGQGTYDYSWASNGHSSHSEGTFVDNVLNGQGTNTYKWTNDVRIRTGTFKNDKLNGQGTEDYIFGDKSHILSEGTFADNALYNGTKTTYNADGSVRSVKNVVNGKEV